MSLQYECLKPQEFMKTYHAEYADSKPQNLESFKAKVEQYRESLEAHKNQNEKGIVSNALMPFLQDLGFQAQVAYKHQANSEIDCALLKDSQVEVIIEAKKLENNKEMFSPNNPNCKALHECILYYLREREERIKILLEMQVCAISSSQIFIAFISLEQGSLKDAFTKTNKFLKHIKDKKCQKNQKWKHRQSSRIL